MLTRAIISLILIMMAPMAGRAQDRIYTKDGAIYEVKVIEIGTREVVYKKWSSLNGPNYILPRKSIERIRFENGDEEIFSRPVALRHDVSGKTTAAEDHRYGRNSVSVSPIHMTNIGPVGLGLSYERVCDKNYIISVYLPVVYSLKNGTSNYNYSYYSTTPNKDKSSMLWFFPGVKLYPTGSNGLVRYSVGPSLAFGMGSRNYTRDVYDPATGYYTATTFDDNIFVMGILINNTLNIYPTPKFRLGLELGLGLPYYTNEEDTHLNYYDSPFRNVPLVQFNFQVGYRF